ncbi:MAG: hypothetical protein IIA61_08240 [Candidatus Marinimicrobia bacterium]|nr:hypothetical protein [Candidatus Neomarinimicrobiota bacterium]
MKKAANFQNTSASGGRFKVVVAMIYVFNQMGIVPDWISFRNMLAQGDLQLKSLEKVDIKKINQFKRKEVFKWKINNQEVFTAKIINLKQFD